MLAAAWASLLTVTASVSLPGTARADCFLSGSTVTCTAPGTGGFDAGAQNGLSVTVQTGATVTIGSNFGTGITLNDLNDPVVNNGTINSTRNLVVGIHLGDSNGLTTGVINNGTMSFTGATSFAISGGSNNVVVNNNSITGTNSPGLISLGDNNAITNNGLLKDNGSGQAINVQDGNTIVNGPSGTITVGNFGFGINASNTAGTTVAGTITNSGAINVGSGSGTGQHGVGIAAYQNYTVNNSGTIIGLSGADGIAITQNNTVNNTNTIMVGAGGNGIEVLGGAGNFVTNSGTVNGSSGIGVLLDTNSGLTLANTGSGTVTAAGSGGIGISVGDSASIVVTNSGTITGDAYAILAPDLTFNPSITTVTNNAGGVITSTASGSTAISIGNGNTATVVNAGAITGPTNAIFGQVNSTVSVTNFGTITATADSGAAISLLGSGTVDNQSAGVISATGLGATGAGFGNGANTLNNFGTINSSNVGGIGVSITGAGTYTNSGTINANGGSSKGIYVGNSGFGTATIVNSGTINANDTSSTNNGVFGDSGSTLNLTNSGTISAAGATGRGVWIDSNSTVTNTGMIVAGSSGVGIFALNNNNAIANSGTITVLGGFGIASNGDANTIANSGTISVGDNGTGIAAGTNSSLPAASSPNILNSGAITGGAGATGITVSSLNQVKNTGTVTVGAGGTGVDFVVDGNVLNNSGAITATGGGYSIQACSCTATANTFNNLAGGVLDGRINVLNQDNTVNNSGLIIISDPNTPIAQFNFTVQNSAGTGSTDPNIFTQTSSGTLAVRIGNTGTADSLVADQITVAGALRTVIQPQLYPNTLTSTAAVMSVTPGGAIVTTFDRFTASSPFFTVTPIYDTGNSTNYTSLSLQLDRIGFGSVPGETPNQRAVGTGLEGAYSTSLTGAAATLYVNLLTAASVSVLDQLSGAGTAATQSSSFAASGLFNNAMMQQGIDWLSGGSGGGAFGAPLQYAPADEAANRPGYEAFAAMRPRQPEPPVWRAWALGFGSTRSIDGDSSLGTADQSLQTAGGALGVERAFGSDLLLGFAAGGSGSRFSVASLSTSGTVDAGHIGGYAVSRWGDVYAAATLNYARLDNRTDRTITGVGADETAHGSFAGDELGGRFELGWRRRIAGYIVTPFVAVEPAALWQHAYSETSTTLAGGVGTLGLSYAARETTSLPTFVGAQFDGQYAFGNGQSVRPFFRAAWVHEFMPQRQIEATFISIPSSSFTVDGTRPAGDAARFSGGATWTIDKSKALFARIDTEFSGSGAMLAGIAGARINW